jgi:hypothetical protein
MDRTFCGPKPTKHEIAENARFKAAMKALQEICENTDHSPRRQAAESALVVLTRCLTSHRNVIEYFDGVCACDECLSSG